MGATSGPISVTSPEGTGTSSTTFTVTPPPAPPVVSSFVPTQGGVGTQVTISGSNFTGANAVTFNTTSTTIFTVNNDSSITVNVPSGATTGFVSVTTPLGGTGSSTTKFTVTGSTRIKDITFDDGNITDPTTGFDAQTGSIRLETASPLKGADSATVTAGSSYGRENFSATDQIFISLYVRIGAIPAGQVRLVRITDQGTTVGAITIETSGKVTLRSGTTNLGATTIALKPGTVYRVGIHQKKGTGSNAVLEGFLAIGDANFTAPFASNGSQNFMTQADSLQIGASTSTGVNLTVDDIRLDTGSMPGPSAP